MTVIGCAACFLLGAVVTMASFCLWRDAPKRVRERALRPDLTLRPDPADERVQRQVEQRRRETQNFLQYNGSEQP